MKRITGLVSKIVIVLLIFGLVNFNYTFAVCATEITEEDSAEESAFMFNPNSAVVQVVLLYVDQSDVKHIVQSGSGVLINETTVVTNKHLLNMSEDLKIQAGAYFSEQLGYTVAFVEPQPVEGEESTQEEVEVSELILAVSNQNDIYIEATEQLSSTDMDFAVLNLKSSIIDREFPTLGDSSSVAANDTIYTFGFPDMDYTNAKYCTLGELVTCQGACLYNGENVIKHSATFSSGASGGVLVDEYGRIIGINTYTGNGENTACPINNIIESLDSNGYVYIQNTEDLDVVDEPVEYQEDYTDKTPLEETIVEAQVIVDGGNEGLYTAESYSKLVSELDEAKATLSIEDVSQGTLNSAQKELRSAIDGLVKIEKKDKTKSVVLIVVASLVAIALIILITIFVIKAGKKKRIKKAEENIKFLDNNVGNSVMGMQPQMPMQQPVQQQPQMHLQQQQVQQPMQQQVQQPMQQQVQQSVQQPIQQSVRQPVQQQQSQMQPVNIQVGYLYRTRTGEAVPVNTNDFIVGKSRNSANYAIDNSNISRVHARIVRTNNQFFIQDMGSTNFTVLNGNQLVPNTSYNLNANDTIYFADEEFIFIIE